MAVYCYFDILEVYDAAAMDAYREKVLATVHQFGGRYIVVGGPFEVKEGNYNPIFPVIIEFATIDMANDWYHSKEYELLKQLRHSAVKANAVFFRGI
jgi:uncharacterized protein (DUF1330 family)